MNIIEKARKKDAEFETFMAGTGKKRITTLMTEFTIADSFGPDAVKTTFERSKHYLSDYKIWSEMVIVLNQKIWEYSKTDQTLSSLYEELWSKAQNMFFERYANNDEAKEYYLKTTD